MYAVLLLTDGTCCALFAIAALVSADRRGEGGAGLSAYDCSVVDGGTTALTPDNGRADAGLRRLTSAAAESRRSTSDELDGNGRAAERPADGARSTEGARPNVDGDGARVR